MSSATAATLERVAARIAAEGGLLEQALLAGGPVVPEDDPGLGAVAAAGPAAAADQATFALFVEAVREAHLLHGGSSRLLDAGDRDLAILAGDRLYALGLAELASLDPPATDAVRELADVIALCALARAHADAGLAEAAWAAGAVAIGWGSSDEFERAKNAARAGSSGAAEELRDAARRIRGGGLPAAP